MSETPENAMSTDGMEQSLVRELDGETLGWMEEDHSRDDVADEVWAFALATVVDGAAITPLGYDVTEEIIHV